MFDKKIFCKDGGQSSVETYGYPLVVSDIKSDGQLKDYKIYGNSQQKIAPSPTSPQKLESVGVNSDLWSTNYRSKGYLDQTGEIIDASNFETTDYIEVTPKTYYTAYMEISNTYTGNCIWFCFYDNDKKFVSTREGMYIPLGNYALDQLVPDEAVYMRVSMGADATKVTKQMLVEGQHTAGEMINLPTGYKISVKATNGTSEEVVNIYLDKPLYKVGNYVDYIDFKNKTVIRNIGEKELTGTEVDWDSDFYNDYFYTNDNTFSDMKTDYQNISVASTHFISKDSSVATDTTINNCCFPYYNQYYPSVGFRYLSITDVDSWKTYLVNQKSANSPVIVYYPLQNKTSESVNLDNLPVFQGTTTYTVVNGLEPSNMYSKR